MVSSQEMAEKPHDKFYFIRHAVSNANEAYREIGKDSWWDTSLFDAALSENGIE